MTTMTDITVPTVGLMMDCETLGLKANAIVTQIALYAWDMEEEKLLPDSLHIHLPIQGQMDLVRPRTLDADTLAWWMKQSDDARAEFDRNVSDEFEELPILLRQFTRRFDKLTNGGKYEYELWANGPQADIVWVESLLNDCGMKAPWKYNRVRDLRTMLSLAGMSSKDVEKPEGYVPHNAAWDCKFQIRCHIEAKRRLRSR